MMPTDLGTRLQEIRELLMNGAGDDALGRIDCIVAELRQVNTEPPASVTPSRLIAAHLSAAAVEIEQTHLAPAADSVEKAIYAATHQSQIGEPDPQLNV